MPDAADFAAMFTSLRAVTDLTKFFIDARDSSVIRTKAIELQREIIATQQSAMAANLAHTATLRRLGELEKEVIDLKAWDAEKEKYHLISVKRVPAGQRAPVAYGLKEPAGVSEAGPSALRKLLPRPHQIDSSNRTAGPESGRSSCLPSLRCRHLRGRRTRPLPRIAAICGSSPALARLGQHPPVGVDDLPRAVGDWPVR